MNAGDRPAPVAAGVAAQYEWDEHALQRDRAGEHVYVCVVERPHVSGTRISSSAIRRAASWTVVAITSSLVGARQGRKALVRTTRVLVVSLACHVPIG